MKQPIDVGCPSCSQEPGQAFIAGFPFPPVPESLGFHELRIEAADLINQVDAGMETYERRAATEDERSPIQAQRCDSTPSPSLKNQTAADEVFARATDVHHIFTVQAAPHLRLVLSNLVSLCKECHSSITATRDSTFAHRGRQ